MDCIYFKNTDLKKELHAMFANDIKPEHENNDNIINNNNNIKLLFLFLMIQIIVN